MFSALFKVLPLLVNCQLKLLIFVRGFYLPRNYPLNEHFYPSSSKCQVSNEKFSLFTLPFTKFVCETIALIPNRLNTLTACSGCFRVIFSVFGNLLSYFLYVILFQRCAGDSRLKQNLPLSSYLLKPLQRITKYPLLISGVRRSFVYVMRAKILIHSCIIVNIVTSPCV